MAKTSKLAMRLAKKIETELGIRCNPETFHRTYAGCNQRASGAWVWIMNEENDVRDVGSCWPASECVKQKYALSLGEYGEILPEENAGTRTLR